MSRDEVIRLAREAGFYVQDWGGNDNGWIKIQQRFAALFEAAIRADCADTVEKAGIAGYGTIAAAHLIRKGIKP